MKKRRLKETVSVAAAVVLTGVVITAAAKPGLFGFGEAKAAEPEIAAEGGAEQAQTGGAAETEDGLTGERNLFAWADDLPVFSESDGAWIQSEDALGQEQWRYRLSDGSYLKGFYGSVSGDPNVCCLSILPEWAWIDGNGDGIAECYGFDHLGNLWPAGTETMDARMLDENGAWEVNGITQKRALTPAAAGQLQPWETGQIDITPPYISEVSWEEVNRVSIYAGDRFEPKLVLTDKETIREFRGASGFANEADYEYVTPDQYYEGMCGIWVEFDNGVCFSMYDSVNYGCISTQKETIGKSSFYRFPENFWQELRKLLEKA